MGDLVDPTAKVSPDFLKLKTLFQIAKDLKSLEKPSLISKFPVQVKNIKTSSWLLKNKRPNPFSTDLW